MKPVLTVLALSVLLGACSAGLKKEDDPGPLPANLNIASEDAESADQMYLKAKALLDRQQYETALSNFENLEATHPFGEHAAQARLDIAYAYYKLNEHQSAVAAIERFLKLYPQSPKADYAYYLKGLANFTRGRSLLENLVSRKLHRMDQSTLRLAFSDFSTLVTRYPDSQYVPDAQRRMAQLRNAMALHELTTAEYYFKRSAMVAVVNRINSMLEVYPETRHSADGLSLLARAHLALGNRQLAAETVGELELADPDHPDLRILGNLRS